MSETARLDTDGVVRVYDETNDEWRMAGDDEWFRWALAHYVRELRACVQFGPFDTIEGRTGVECVISRGDAWASGAASGGAIIEAFARAVAKMPDGAAIIASRP